MSPKIKNIFKRIKIKTLKTYFRLIRKVYPLKYPQNVDSKIYIHLGCGEVNSPEFINVDGRFFPHIHHISEVNNLPFFKNDFADLIYASHILEHIPVINLEDTLLEWKRILKVGGTLRIGVPDFDTILQIYKDNNNDIKSIWKPLMGGQEYKKNYHFSVFNKNYLTELLIKCGFSNIQLWEPERVKNHNINDWTSMKYEVNGKIYPISLNIEASK